MMPKQTLVTPSDSLRNRHYLSPMDSFVKVKKSRHVLAKNSSFGTATSAKSTIATSKAEYKTTAPAILKMMPKRTSVTPSESLKNQPCALTIPSEMSPETEPTESLAVLEKAHERKPFLQGKNQLCDSAFSTLNVPKAETSHASKDFHQLELAMPSEDQSNKTHRLPMKFIEVVSGDSPVLKKSSRRKLTMPDPVQESDDELSPKKMLKTGSCGSQKFSSIQKAENERELNEFSISTPRCPQSELPQNERPSPPSSKMCPERKPSENQNLKIAASPTESFEEPAAWKKSPKRKLAIPEENVVPYILTLLECKPSPRDVKTSPKLISPRSRDLLKISPSDFNSSPRSSNASPKNAKMSPRNVNTSPRIFKTSPRDSKTSPRSRDLFNLDFNTSPRNFCTSPKTSNSSPRDSKTSPRSTDLFNLDFNTSPRNSRTKPKCLKTTPPRKQSPSYVESSPAVENAAPDLSATFKRPLLKPRRSRKFRKEKVCYRTRSCPPSSNKTSLLTASETSDDHLSALPLGFKISSQNRELRDERSRGILAREITKQDKNVLQLESSTKSVVRRRRSKMATQSNSLSFVLQRSFKGPGFDMSDKKQDSSDRAHMASLSKNTLRLPAAKDDVGFSLSSDLLENMYGSLNTSNNQQGEDALVSQQSLDLPLPLQELLRFPSVDNLPRHSSRMFGAPDLILMSQQGNRKGKGKGTLRLGYSEDKENVDPIFYPDLGLPLHGNTDT